MASAKPASLRTSLVETVIGTLFATLPIWFFPIFISNLIKGGPSTSELVYNSIRRGDLFIYSAALMGPIIYTITKNYAELSDDDEQPTTEGKNVKSSGFRKLTFAFPYGPTFVIISILICMVAAISYGISNISEVSKGGLIVSEEFLVKLSFWIYVFSLLCLFTVSAYREELSTINKNLPEEERDFLKRWKHRND
ncbi:MAG: hypothetical protein NTV73_16850 [Hyphomicrobiales bacterium]|nr:hypothetical protein [Hyphomicrobiales bacterium]